MAVTHFRKLPIADERIHLHPVIYCVDATVVNLARAATNGTVPATDAEVLKVRAVAGGTGGETLAQARTAMKKVYGFDTIAYDTRLLIQFALEHDIWLAVIGQYAALPDRIKNAGQSDVTHCVAIGPGPVIADPLQKVTPKYVPVTMDEVIAYAATGNFESIGLLEYGHAIWKGHVAVKGSLFLYTKHSGTLWTRRPVRNVLFSATTTLKEKLIVLRKSRWMVKIVTGAYKGLWLQSDVSAVHYTEIV